MEAHTAGQLHVQLRPIFICGLSVHSANNTWLKNSICMKLLHMKSKEEINDLNFFLFIISFPAITLPASPLAPPSSSLTQSVMTIFFFLVPVNVNEPKSSLTCMYICACHVPTCTQTQKDITSAFQFLFSSFISLCVIKMLIETKSAKRYVITCVWVWMRVWTQCVFADLRAFSIVLPHFLRLSADDSGCLCACV